MIRMMMDTMISIWNEIKIKVDIIKIATTQMV